MFGAVSGPYRESLASAGNNFYNCYIVPIHNSKQQSLYNVVSTSGFSSVPCTLYTVYTDHVVTSNILGRCEIYEELYSPEFTSLEKISWEQKCLE